MAFFDEIGRKITRTGQGASKAVKNMAEITRINGMVSEEERRLAGYYQEIGRIYCEKYASVENKSDLDGYVTAVREISARIAQYRQQVIRLKGVRSCPSCGAEAANDTLYCSYCGVRLPSPISEGCCTVCGTPLEPGAVYCIECGHPVAASAVTRPPVEAVSPEVPETLEMPEKPDMSDMFKSSEMSELPKNFEIYEESDRTEMFPASHEIDFSDDAVDFEPVQKKN